MSDLCADERGFSICAVYVWISPPPVRRREFLRVRVLFSAYLLGGMLWLVGFFRISSRVL
jgi:hypothetical protein